ncbi:MAG: hypothetical protein E5V77_21920, partial [Mesorhizobium sp.]
MSIRCACALSATLPTTDRSPTVAEDNLSSGLLQCNKKRNALCYAAPKLLRCSKSCNSIPDGWAEHRSSFMLHVLYLVHDVSDPAVRRRVQMLKAG